MKSEGFTPPNGQSIEDFVKMKPQIEPNLLG